MHINERIDALLEGWDPNDTATYSAVLTDAKKEIQYLEGVVRSLQLQLTQRLNAFTPRDIAQQHAYWLTLGRDDM